MSRIGEYLINKNESPFDDAPEWWNLPLTEEAIDAIEAVELDRLDAKDEAEVD